MHVKVDISHEGSFQSYIERNPMLKASTALKGGAIVGLSALTFLATGGSAIAATSPAANAITITPPSSGTTGNTGGCLVYTATVTAPTGTTGSLDVLLAQPAGASSTTASFCTPAGTNVPAGDSTGKVTHSFTMSSSAITFGVSDAAGEADSITVFNDANSDGVLTGGEQSAASSATFVANTGDAAVKQLVITHPTTSQSLRPGDFAVYEITALNNNAAVPVADQGVSGAHVWWVSSGPDATTSPGDCGLTNASGLADCFISSPATALAGTDTVTFFVNNAPLSGPGLDTGDTQLPTSMTNWGKAPAGDTAVAFCGVAPPSTSTSRSCTQTIDASNPANVTAVSEAFGVVVLDPATSEPSGSLDKNLNSDAGSTGTVSFSMTGASSTATLSAATAACNTSAATIVNGEGSCTANVTVHEPNPSVNEKITVTAALVGGASTQTDSASLTLTAAPATARNITLTPASQSIAIGHSRVLTATVTDAQGHPVSGVNLDFTSTGSGAFITGCALSATCVAEQSNATGFLSGMGLPQTNASGQIQVNVASITTGTETISATIDPAQTTQCANPAGFVNGLPVSGIGAGNCTTAGAVHYTLPPKVSETPHLTGHKNGHVVHLAAKTHPNLRHVSVHFYRLRSGILHLVGVHSSGASGTAHITLHRVKNGHYTYVARVVGAGSHVVSHRSNHRHIHIH
jgi:hypothetical protein